MPKFLHVGCGRKTRMDCPHPFHAPDWQEIRLDIDPDVGVDILAPVTDPGAVESASMDALFCSHVIEHVHSFEVVDVLSGFRRVLRSGGYAILACPDVQMLGHMIAEGRIHHPLYESASGPINVLDILYGHQAAIAKGAGHMAHKTAFTKETLTAALHQAGFATVWSYREMSRLELWAIGWPETTGNDTVIDTVRAVFEPPPFGFSKRAEGQS